MGWQGGTDPIKWAAKMKDAPRQAINAFAFKVFAGVVDKTPVDTGACRQNWLVTVNSETSAFDPSKTTGQVLLEGGAVIEAAVGDDKIFIQNNAPYASIIEHGGYPSPPKHGGLDKKGRPKTAGGYSTQAPSGMICTVLAKADQLFEKAIKETMGK
jgi:phage gpG-like protein